MRATPSSDAASACERRGSSRWGIGVALCYLRVTPVHQQMWQLLNANVKGFPSVGCRSLFRATLHIHQKYVATTKCERSSSCSPQFDDRAARLSDRLQYCGADLVVRLLHYVARQMRIALRTRRVFVAEQLANRIERHTATGGD